MARIVQAEQGELEAVADVLASGGIAVIPTDTVYGVAARVDRQSAIDKIFLLKARTRDKPLPVLVPDLATANLLGELGPEAADAAASGWPGALTIVVRRSGSSQAIDIGGDHSTIGLRVPAHGFTVELMRITGPLAATSANPSGDATAHSVSEIAEIFADNVDIYVDGGVLDAEPSRVMSYVDEPRTLR